MAADYDPVYQAESKAGPRVCISRCHDAQGELVPVPPLAFRPSTNLGAAVPIIEREHINLSSDFGRWMARHGKRDDYSGRRVATRHRDSRLPHARIRGRGASIGRIVGAAPVTGHPDVERSGWSRSTQWRAPSNGTVRNLPSRS